MRSSQSATSGPALQPDIGSLAGNALELAERAALGAVCQRDLAAQLASVPTPWSSMPRGAPALGMVGNRGMTGPCSQAAASPSGRVRSRIAWALVEARR